MVWTALSCGNSNSNVPSTLWSWPSRGLGSPDMHGLGDSRRALSRGRARRRYLGGVTGLIRRERAEIAPGAVHLPGWLSHDEQTQLVTACREWARPPAGMRAARLPSGGVMSVQTVCLGWHWIPYRYSRTAEDVDGAPVKPFPGWLADLGRRAVRDAYGATDAAAGDDPDARYDPDVALINFYDGQARMGMHADRDERSLAPVVSLSLGATCVFRFGNTESRSRPWTDVELGSGDLFVFGGPSRLAYHGVPKTRPGTGDPGIGLSSGRLNITLRESGLA
jgi:alkylated DNA repair protein (DNA oxidative demethylase)